MTGAEEDTLVQSVIEAEQAEKEASKPKEEAEASAPEADKEEEAAPEAEDAEEQGEEEADEADAEEGSEEVEPPVKGSRAQARIRKQAEDLKAERLEKERLIAEKARAEAELEHVRQQQEFIRAEAQKKAEQERLSLLSPEEKAIYEANQRVANLEYKLALIESQRRDDQDRATFHAKAAHDPLYGKYAKTVEDMYQDGLKRGVVAPREELLRYAVGKELLADSAKKVEEKKKAAGKRIDAVTSKPASAKGDVASAKKGKTEEDRLRGVLI